MGHLPRERPRSQLTVSRRQLKGRRKERYAPRPFCKLTHRNTPQPLRDRAAGAGSCNRSRLSLTPCVESAPIWTSTLLLLSRPVALPAGSHACMQVQRRSMCQLNRDLRILGSLCHRRTARRVETQHRLWSWLWFHAGRPAFLCWQSGCFAVGARPSDLAGLAERHNLGTAAFTESAGLLFCLAACLRLSESWTVRWRCELCALWYTCRVSAC